MNRLIPLSRIKGSDTVAYRHRAVGRKQNRELLDICASDWANMEKMRHDRERAMRYANGDQWSDLITYKGKTMTEAEYIVSQGNIPLVNNLVRRVVNNIAGVYVNGQSEPVCSARDRDEQSLSEMMSLTLQCNWQLNKMQDLMSVLIEEFVISGMVFTEEFYEEREGKMDSWTDICDPNKICFAGGMVDPRHRDIYRICYMHDTTFSTLCSRFAHSEEDHRRLSELYHVQAQLYTPTQIGYLDERRQHHHVSFYAPDDPAMCRVYEIWTKETRPRLLCHDWLAGDLYKVEPRERGDIEKENAQRLRDGRANGLADDDIPLIDMQYVIDEYWYYQYLTPDGTILSEGESPFAHKGHPFSMRIYPFVNGEAYSIVNSIIDQQRYINRMIVINDFVIRTGAKGVTMVPADAVPDGMTPEEFAEEWARVDGILVYTAKPGVPEPKQFYNHTTNIGTAEMIQLQMQIMEDASSVQPALQGKQPYAGTSAAAYAMQTTNSTAALSNMLSRFSSFMEDVATKKVFNIQQFYDDRRILNIAGNRYAGVRYYDPALCRDIQYDVSIHESPSTPTRRMIANDQLMAFWDKGAITLEMLLENGDFPFADQLLQSLQAARQQQSDAQQAAAQPGAPEGPTAEDIVPQGPQFSQDLKQQVQAKANQADVNAARAMLQAQYPDAA